MIPVSEQWNAADYHEQSSVQELWARELIGKLDLRGDEVLLDLGCGTGRITALFAQRLPAGQVVGIDSSREMIDFANRLYADFPNLRFYHMDAQDFQLPQRFDVVFSNAVLHWIKEHPAVLRQVREHLKPGGTILFQMGGRGNAQPLVDLLAEISARHEWRDSFIGFEAPHHFYDVEDYERWLPQAGLRPLRLELIPKLLQQPGADGLRGWIRTTWFPYINQVPPQQQDAFLSQVVAEYLERYPLDNMGRASVPMQRLEVEATTA